MPLKDQFGQKLPGLYCTITIELFKGLKKMETPGSRQSCRLPDSPIREVVFRIRIFPRIRSQNRNGSKCSVRDLGQSDLCKNLGKFGSLPCPFKVWLEENFNFFSKLFSISLSSLWQFCPGNLETCCGFGALLSYSQSFSALSAT
jgi:hypothetical protein